MKRNLFNAMPSKHENNKWGLRQHFPQLLALIFALLLRFISYAQAPNQYVPIIDGEGPFTSANLTARTSTTVVVPDFNNVNNIKNSDTNDAASVGLTGLLGSWIEIDYSGGNFPQGSEVGFVITKGLLSASLLGGVTLTTYSTASGESGVVSTSTTNQLLGVSVAGGKEKISFISSGGDFRRVRLTFSGINLSVLTSILGDGASINVYNAEILVPQTGVLPTDCNVSTRLNQGDFPAIATYGTTGIIGSGGLTGAQVAGILNSIQNVENIVSTSTSDYALLPSVNASIAGDGYLSVKLLSGTIPQNYFAGFEIENLNGFLANVNLLNGMTIQALNNGTVVQSMSSFQILSGSILGGSLDRQTIGFVVTEGAFNEIRLVLTSGLLSAGVSLGETRIYNAVVKNFCDASFALSGTTILSNGHTSTMGMGVTVNGNNSGLINASILPNAQSFALQMPNLIDNNFANYVSISSTLGINAVNRASLSVMAPAHKFRNGLYAGFIVRGNTPLIDLALLQGITINTYNDGELVEHANVSNNILRLNLLNIFNINDDLPEDARVIYMPTTEEFNEVGLEVEDLAGVGNELQVFSAFVSEEEVLPVVFGNISALLQGKNLSVQWSTFSETNNKEFVIEGSVDGKNWKKIGSVASQANGGNSDVSLNYSFSKSLSGIMLGGLGVMALLSLAFIKNRVVKMCFGIAFLIMIGVACSKREAITADDTPELFIRIAQIDQDGSISYSKAVKAIIK